MSYKMKLFWNIFLQKEEADVLVGEIFLQEDVSGKMKLS